jgi:hypothetical protein
MFECQYCGKNLKNKAGLSMHEKACDDNLSDDFDPEVHSKGASEAGKLGIIAQYGSIQEYEVACSSSKCDEEFTIEEREKSFPKKDNYFCSNPCARSFATQEKREEINQKISESLKGRPFTGFKDKSEEEEKQIRRQKPREVVQCPVCDVTFEIVPGSKIFCSDECWRKDQANGYQFSTKPDGGVGQGQTKNFHSGKYKGIWCDSSWELAWVVFGFDFEVELHRVKRSFLYKYNGKKHEYFPDFYLPSIDMYVEVKNYMSSRDEAKVSQFPYDIEVIVGEEMDPILYYARVNYGDKFWNNLYD